MATVKELLDAGKMKMRLPGWGINARIELSRKSDGSLDERVYVFNGAYQYDEKGDVKLNHEGKPILDFDIVSVFNFINDTYNQWEEYIETP